ncbi:MAG: AraC family transcriptional regulator [Bacteroidota bacterium]
MKPNFLKIVPPIENSLVIKTDRALATPWHYHPEIELLYCIRGRGTDFVGNGIESIEEGELLMFGENLPHTRLGDEEFYRNNPEEEPEAVVIQFRKDFLGPGFFAVKEFGHIGDLIHRACKGLRFSGSIRQSMGKRLLEVRKMEGTKAILELLGILNSLALSKEYSFFNNVNYTVDTHEKHTEKINRVYRYTIGNFQRDISLDTVAGLTNHSRAAFCRFFKAHTRKTYFQYLNEIRIAHACRLLREGDLDVTRTCYASGFNNLSNFHKQFKKITGGNPTQYRDNLLSKIA